MGTTWRLRVSPTTMEIQEDLASAAQARLDELERVFSNWRADSAVSRFNASRSTEWQAVPRELVEVVDFAREISRQTGGAFDVTSGPLIDLWGFGAKGRITSPPDEAAIAGAKERIGWKKLEVMRDPPMLRKSQADLEINVSALVEGYAVDDLVKRLRGEEHQDFLLDVGGELFAGCVNADGLPWQVGVQQPHAELGTVLGAMPLRDRALATSGTYRHFFEHGRKQFAHVIDPRTGRPVDHRVVSVSVVADTCLAADAWATALLVLGAVEGRALAQSAGVEAMFIEEAAR